MFRGAFGFVLKSRGDCRNIDTIITHSREGGNDDGDGGEMLGNARFSLQEKLQQKRDGRELQHIPFFTFGAR